MDKLESNENKIDIIDDSRVLMFDIVEFTAFIEWERKLNSNSIQIERHRCWHYNTDCNDLVEMSALLLCFCCIVATESEIFQAKAAEACNKTFLSFWVHDRVNIRRLSLGRVDVESRIFLSSSFKFSSTSGDDIRRHWSYEREVDLLNWFFFIHRLFSISFELKLTIVWQTSLLHGEHSSSLAWIKKTTYIVVFPKMIFKFNVKCN